MSVYHRTKVCVVMLFVILCLVSSGRIRAEDGNDDRVDTLRLPVGVTALQITVDEDGIYEVTKDQLRTAGFPVETVNPNSIRMMYRGEPLAYQFVNDNGDALFDDDEAVRFYGWGFDGSRYEQFFVDKNVYWLWFDGDTNGERVVSESNPAATGRTDVEQFPESLYIEQNRIFTTPALKLDEFDQFEADSWYWDRYGQRYHGRYVSAFNLFVAADQTVDLTGTAGADATIIVKRFSLDRGNNRIIVETTTADVDGNWSLLISNDLNTTYEMTIEADDGSEAVLDATLLADETTITLDPITHFFDKKRYILDIPRPAPTDDVGTFVAEFMTDKDGYYTTTVEFAGGHDTVNLERTDYAGAAGEFVNRDLIDGENMLVVSGENVVDRFGAQESYLSFSFDNFSTNRVWFNSVTLNYTRLLVADDNQLQFGYDTAGEHNFLVSGFAESDVDKMIVWDISDRLNPVHVVLHPSDRTTADLTYRWRIGKSVVDGEQAQMLATVLSNVRSVTDDQLETYTAVDIDPADNAGAEWVAISHANFLESTHDLATYRQGVSSLSTHVVDVEHIINQYGFGYNVPEAIRSYMIHAYADRTAWGVAPEYLLLVGDSDWNILDRDCFSCSVWDADEPTFVVSDYQFIDPYTGMNTTDHRYAMLDGDDVYPDVAVGRLPVKTSEEVDTILAKMRTYEQAVSEQADWVSNMLFLADDKDAGGDFCRGVERTRGLLETYAPDMYQFETECLDNYLSYDATPDDLRAAKERVRTSMNESVNGNGVGIVNYRGHGSVDNWGAGLQYLSADATNGHLEAWQNSDFPTVIISADCLDTEFGRSAYPGLAETLLKHSAGGSVAHFGSTGLGLDSDHTILVDGFYEGLTIDSSIRTIGDAAVNAKNHFITTRMGFVPSIDLTDIAYWNDVIAFTVLGDPALMLPAPDDPTAIMISGITAETHVISWVVVIVVGFSVVTVDVLKRSRKFV